MNGHSSPEDYPTPPATVARDHLFVLSGHSENACRKIAANLTQYAARILTSDLQDSILNDLAFSLARRSALRYRIAFTCSDAEDFIERLGSIEGRDIEPQLSLPNPRLAFVFTGQGAQWYGMGQELLESCAAFQDSMRRASYSLTKLGCDWHLQTELHQSAKTSRVDDPAVGQPICTAIQISLVDALRSLGLRPIAVVGHSSGEIAAAYAAGAVSFEDAIAISYHRGRLVNLHGKTSEAKGAMLAVGETPERVTKLIAEVPSHLGSMVVACINSPGSVTVSGDKAAVEQLRGDLDREQVFNRLLKTNDVAYHSHQMRPLAQEYLRALSHIEGRIPDPSVRWISSVTGQYLGSQVVGPKYWVDNLVSPVLFAQALEKTCVDRTLSDPLTIDTIVEIGPHSTLAGPVKQTLKSVGEEARHVVYSNALTRHKNAVTTFVDMLGTLFVRGHPVDIKRISTVFGQTHGKLLADLPNYPWDHDTKYWHETRLSSEYRNRVFPRHELLGVRAPNFNVLEPSWRNYIRLSEIPWLKGHEIHGQVIWPAAAYIAMALEAARQQAATHDPPQAISKYTLRDIVFSKALIVDAEAEDVEIHFTLRPLPRSARESSSIWDEFRVFSVNKKKHWDEHCRGLIGVRLSSQSSEVGSLEQEVSANLDGVVSEVKARSQTVISPEKFYSSFQQVGLNWHDAFGNLTGISAGPSSSFCTVRPVQTHQSPAVGYEIPYLIHPGTLDSCFQTALVPVMAHGRRPLAAHVVTFIEKLELSVDLDCRGGIEVHLFCKSSGANHNIGTVATHPSSNTLPFLLSIEKLQLTELPSQGLDSAARQLCTNLIWEPIESGIRLEQRRSDGIEHPDGIGHPNGTVEINGTGDPTGTAQVNGTGHSVEYCVEIVQHDGLSQATDLTSKLQERLENARVRLSSLQDGLFTDNICVLLSFDNELFLPNLRESEFHCLQRLVLNARGILWVTTGAVLECANPSAATITGLARTLRVENPHLRFATLDLDPHDLSLARVTELISTMVEGPCFAPEATLGDVDFEYADRGGQLHVARIVDNEEVTQSLHDLTTTPDAKIAAFFQQGRPLTLEAGQPGLLDTLRWVDDSERGLRPGPDEICLKACAFGVNFRDLLVAVGQLGKDATMAGECSGIVTAVGANLSNEFSIGDRVCAFGAQPYASYPVVKGHTCFRIPDDMTFEVAASIPIVYSTVVYALIHIGQLQRGQKLLVHSATGGVGQAAVMLAQHLGAEVFATVGSAEKKQFLIDEFSIAADHIFSSRTTAFREGILGMTEGKGVDVVLNSLTGEQFRESCNCLAEFGRFIEIGKRDLLMNARMDMGFFVKNITFSSLDLMLVGQLKPSLARQLMKESVELVSAGQVKPVNIASAPLSDIQRVFRQMQAGKHMGKFVLYADADTQVKVTCF